jgi:hypothetical protein
MKAKVPYSYIVVLLCLLAVGMAMVSCTWDGGNDMQDNGLVTDDNPSEQVHNAHIDHKGTYLRREEMIRNFEENFEYFEAIALFVLENAGKSYGAYYRSGGDIHLGRSEPIPDEIVEKMQYVINELGFDFIAGFNSTSFRVYGERYMHFIDYIDDYTRSTLREEFFSEADNLRENWYYMRSGYA